jgi:hypothetical protein
MVGRNDCRDAACRRGAASGRLVSNNADDGGTHGREGRDQGREGGKGQSQALVQSAACLNQAR